MIISFLGKGGSGKTSMATQMTLCLQGEHSVLAIDADHNMDLVFNLTAGEIPEDMSYLGGAMADALNYVGLSDDEKYTKAFLEGTATRFRFVEDQDEFTQAYTKQLGNDLYAMASGPQTDRVLYGKSCSHFLSTPLKLYLPLLELSSDAAVVVDEKAGADGASTGIVSGVDVGVIVSEPSLHGTKTANQISELLTFFGTPHIVVGNKVSSKEDKKFLEDNLDEEPFAYFESISEIKRDPFSVAAAWKPTLEAIYESAQERNNNDRLDRTIDKFQRNAKFAA